MVYFSKMFGTYQLRNSECVYNQMDFGSVITRHTVKEFEDTVSEDGFTEVLYHFLRIRYALQNPKISDYQKALETFQQQYYHSFLYHYKDRNTHCQRFVKTLQTFHDLDKKNKKQYVELFDTLTSFAKYMGKMPGGHYKGIPFVFTDASAQKWFFDEVTTLKKVHHVRGNSKFYPKYQDHVWTGHTDCPANHACLKPPNVDGTPQKVSASLAMYLICVGYETQDSVREKWNVECNVTDATVHDYTLVHNHPTRVSEVHRRLIETHQETMLMCVDMGMHSVDNLERRTLQHLARVGDSYVEQLCSEHEELKREYQRVQDQSSEQEMLLHTMKRKLDNMDDALDELETVNKRTKREAHDEIEYLHQCLQRKDYELRESIQAQWHLYRQIHPQQMLR